MNPASVPALNTLEFLGALSARLAHSLSNHLAVVSGNLCVATALPDDPEKVAAALHSAMKGANEAGMLLSRFVDLRRAVAMEGGAISIQAALDCLSGWAANRTGWTLESPADLSLADKSALGMPINWLRFALDALADETKAKTGAIQASLQPAKPPAGCILELVFLLPGTKLIDWNLVRRDLINFKLTAAYELIGQAGGKIDSTMLDDGSQQVRLQFRLRPDSL